MDSPTLYKRELIVPASCGRSNTASGGRVAVFLASRLGHLHIWFWTSHYQHISPKAFWSHANLLSSAVQWSRPFTTSIRNQFREMDSDRGMLSCSVTNTSSSDACSGTNFGCLSGIVCVINSWCWSRVNRFNAALDSAPNKTKWTTTAMN